jgi:hypothetical protein
MQNDNFGFFDVLAILSLVLQLQVYEETKRQTTTDDLMGELRKQDKEYFDKIIENQNLILEKLAELG